MTDPRLNDPITRRLFLKRAAVGASALSLPSLIAACGGGGGISAQSNAGGASTEVKQQLADTLVFANWPLYIDSEKGNKRPSLDQFTAQSGVKVKYIEEVNDNEEWFGKFQAQLSQGQDIGRDLTVLTDWMAARMVRLGYVQKKDKSAIPNEANLVSTLQHPTWDPDRAYSLPWQSGMTGIAYNKKETGPVTSIGQLLTDAAIKGKVTCLTEMPDCMGLIMQSNGDDPTTVDPAAFDKAIGTLQDAVDSGQIRRFTGNDYGDDLSAGNVAAAMAWSGDVVQLQLDNPDLEFVLPDDGGMIWTDNMLIPTGGDVFTASTYMNFVYDPKIAAEIEDWVNYICPVEGAKDELLKIDPGVAKNPLIFPTEDMLANVKSFDAEAADNPDFKEKFQTVIGA
ncbi:MAG TPA: spermidine/putrescine ABC transporter substrate-binding protein [Gaiellaceae bacterium]|jgi:spermidine/putrescine transport system substrate-binding protein|nr:spermidine/putrescine ABC transporter substrate-binding protein [Gaiellaceae bacterium]